MHQMGREAMEVPIFLTDLRLCLVCPGMDPTQPNPVEGSLEFDLLVLDPDTIITFGNPPTI